MNQEVLRALRHRALNHPEDIDAHLVFADALLTQGDELGAYISAMLMRGDGELTPGLETRLLGRLKDCVYFWDLESGFLRAVGLSQLRVQTFRSLIGVSEWEGVNRLALNTRIGRRGHPLPSADVLRLVTHPSCSHLRILERLDFEAFVGLCEVTRQFERLQVVGAPQWGVNTPLAKAALRVTELELEGQGIDAPVAWLRTWGRAVFDRVEVLRIGLVAAQGLELVANRPGQSMKQVISRDWSATREGKAWHFDLRLVGNSVMALYQSGQLRELMRVRLSPIASRFTVHVPELPGDELARIRGAAEGVPIELQVEGAWRSLEDIVAAGEDAPF
jgi:hypothetical protein